MHVCLYYYHKYQHPFGKVKTHILITVTLFCIFPCFNAQKNKIQINLQEFNI